MPAFERDLREQLKMIDLTPPALLAAQSAGLVPLPLKAIMSGIQKYNKIPILAQATLPDSKSPWPKYVDNYDLIRDTMAQVLEGFEDFNARARHPHGFGIAQPARERVFQTPSGRAEFSSVALPVDVDAGKGRLLLATIRSHDQFNTTIYSNDDRYRGLKGLRTVILMNDDDMRDRGT